MVCLKRNLLDDIANETDFFVCTFRFDTPARCPSSTGLTSNVALFPESPRPERAAPALDLGNGFTQKSRSCVANAFVGSTPRHPIAARYLQLVMDNVYNSLYPANTLLATGPCLLGMAVLHVRKDFGGHAANDDDGMSTPIHQHRVPGRWKGHNITDSFITWRGERIALDKCVGCGRDQSWTLGNNYNELFDQRRYYCEDAAAIYQPSLGRSA